MLEAVNQAVPSCGGPSGGRDRGRYQKVGLGWGGQNRPTGNLGLHAGLFVGAEQLSLDGLHHTLETPAGTWRQRQPEGQQGLA